MDEEKDCSRFSQQALISGRLNLNTEKQPQLCRRIFKDVYNLIKDKAGFKSIRTIHLPTNDWNDDNEDNGTLDLLSEFQNLNICVLKGGRRGKCLCDGMTSLPASFTSLEHLRHVDLSFNRFTSFPSQLGKLTSLKLLIMDYNSLEVMDLKDLPCSIEELYCRHNRIGHLEGSCDHLSELKIIELSSNQIDQIPPSVASLSALLCFNLKDNRLKSVPLCALKCKNLQKLYLSHNDITFIEESLDLPHSLELVDLSFNKIASFSQFYQNNPIVCIRGNPTERNLKEQQKDENAFDKYDVSLAKMDSDFASFDIVSHHAVGVALPCGVEMIFPKFCVKQSTLIFCKLIPPEETELILNPSDQLLSDVLQLGPNGMKFDDRIKITIPFHYSAFDEQHREIIIRSLTQVQNGNKYEDLEAAINLHDDNKEQTASTYANHFTVFAVVSRLVEDTVQVDQNANTILWSSCNPLTKLSFPSQSVAVETKIKLQTLRVTPSYLQRVQLSDDVVSDVIHLSTEPKNTVFQQAVTIHLCLPDVLIGKTFDENQLRLLKWTSVDGDWNDVTGDTSLTFSTVDVSFQTNYFCRYWLVWENIKGVVRQVYRRLTTYNVQFLCMQRKVVPTAVIAQCVREENVDERVKQLSEQGYFGEDPCTGVQQLMEGEIFKIQVIGGIQLKSHDEHDRRHLEEKVLMKRFHSQHPPQKTGFSRFCIESSGGDTREVKTGYVSFYKFSHQPVTKGEEVKLGPKQLEENSSRPAMKRSVHNRQESTELSSAQANCKGDSGKEEHLDDVLIVLEPPAKPLPPVPEFDVPLKFGELGTGMFTEVNLRHISGFLGSDWMEFGHYLGLKTAELDRIQMDYPNNTKEQIFRMLRYWSYIHMHDEDCVQTFLKALMDADRKDIADQVDRIYKDGVERYENSVKKLRRNHQ